MRCKFRISGHEKLGSGVRRSGDDYGVERKRGLWTYLDLPIFILSLDTRHTGVEMNRLDRQAARKRRDQLLHSAQGRDEEADKALAEFRKRYPDFRISEEMLKRVEKSGSATDFPKRESDTENR